MSLKKIQTLVERFDPIGLKDMDKVQLMNRMDTKFTFTQEQLTAMLPKLKNDYFILSVGGVLISEYESLYYDDPKMKFYVDHHRKKLDRFKIRFRRYISSNIAFLEVKHKKNGRTNKKRIPANGLDLAMSEDQVIFLNSTGVQKSGISIADLKPSLINSFKRITLVNKVLAERLTLDINLKFEWEDKEKSIDDIVIAELKQGDASRNSTFYQLMKDNQIRPLRISKYCLGIINMHGKENVRYNRFKKKLLKLNKLQINAA